MTSGGEARFGGRVVLCALGTLAGLLLLAPGAGALELVICERAPEGQPEEAENCNAPSGVAADRTEGLLYVADDGNQEVDVFDLDLAGGSYVESFPLGSPVSAIAVDNDAGSTARGDIYLYDTGCDCVRRFEPGGSEVVPPIGEGQFASQAQLALGPGGLIHVADNLGGEIRLQVFDHEGTETLECLLGPSGSLRGLAVDSTGAFYLSNGGGAGVRKFDAACNPLGGVHAFEGNASFSSSRLATDAAGNLFVRDVGGPVGGRTAIYAYTPAGEPLRVLYGGGLLQQAATSIAPLGGGTAEDIDDLVVAESQEPLRVVRYGFEPPGPVIHPDPQFTEASEALIANTKATLATRINPEGKATSFHFEYVEDAAYQKDKGEGGDGFAEASESAVEELTPGTTPNFAPPLFRLSPDQIEVGCPDPEDPPQPFCLKPQTLYRFRAVATNADGGPHAGPESTFETKPPFVILDTWSSAVGIDSARLHARVNPLGIQTEGHFEYVEEETCFADEEAAEEEGESPEEVAEACFERAQSTAKADFGEAEAFQARSVQLSSLSPGTTHYYRAVVENAFEQADVSEALAFRTFAPLQIGRCPNDAHRVGAGAGLPDCRAYEMVSPLDKEGGEIVVVDPEVAGGGDQFRSAATVPVAGGPGLAYSSHRAFGKPAGAPQISMYVAQRSPDGWSSEGISPPREDATFNSDIALQNQYRLFDADLTSAWLQTDSDPPLGEGAVGGFPGLYRRDNNTGTYEALCPVEPPNRESDEYIPSVAAVSADGEVAALQANDALSSEAVEDNVRQVYACADRDGDGGTGDELPVLVSVLPGGEANPAHSGVGIFEGQSTHREASDHNAVSADGSRIYWSDRGTDTSAPGKIYLRENPLGEGPECTPGAPCTREVSEAVGGPGSEAKATYWTASPEGSAAVFSFSAGALAGNLYRFDATNEAEPTELLAEGVSGLAGWSEDATRLYAVSSKALDEGAVAGEPNLYLLEAGEEPVLVAPLSGTEAGKGCDVDTFRPIDRCTRASADGTHLLFVSADPLTEYDNTDLTSPAPCGEPGGLCDAEVYLFDAAAPEGEGLRCVSCNPTGARPKGRALPEGALNPSWFAARIPTHWDSSYGSRVISADGRRLFFESFEALSPRDSNGALDVYQWEEPGKGTCAEGAPEFSLEAGGCISLISSGQSPHGSWFADASADGSDVFFRTAESLWPADPGLIDLYDARIGGGYPPPEETEDICEGDACAHPPEAPSPASAAFAGPEGLPPSPGPSCRRPAKRAKRLARRAKRLRRAARRSSAPKRSRQMRRRAKGTAKRARRLSAEAKRCRRARRAQAREAGQ